MGGMWIGRPGALREITDGAASFDRSPDLGVSEFRALGGGVTTWAPPVQPRRLKLSWVAMLPGDVNHLDRLARRVDGPGPLAVLDPLAGNLLSADQAAGLGDPAKWGFTAGQITMYSGAFGRWTPNTVSVDALPAAGTTDLTWKHPYWTGYPVTPGLVLTFWVPGLVAYVAKIAGMYINWFDANRNPLTPSSQPGAAVPLVATAPSRAAFAVPVVRFNALGTWDLGVSVLNVGNTSAALLAGATPTGEGTPAYSITGYTHAPAGGDGAYRNIGLELVEVTSATG